MSIATNIDGTSGGANQLLDLLALVSNPAVYENKIKALQSVTDEYNKAIALVGPADEVLALRQKAQDDQSNATKLLAEAAEQAQALVAEAKAEAAEIVKTAKDQAAKAIANAKAQSDAVEADKTAVETLRAEVSKDQAVLASQQAEVQTKLELAELIAEQAKQAKAEAEALKADVIAKHKAFIETL